MSVYWGIIEKYHHNWVNAPTNIGVLFLFASQGDGQLKHKYQPIDPNSFSRFDLADNKWSLLTAIYVSDVDQPVHCFHFVLNWDQCANFRFESIARFWTAENRQTAWFLLKLVEMSYSEVKTFSTCTFRSEIVGYLNSGVWNVIEVFHLKGNTDCVASVSVHCERNFHRGMHRNAIHQRNLCIERFLLL